MNPIASPTPDNTVNGATVVYGVIGDPVSHSFSPQIHRYFAGLCGINLVYVPFHVTGAGLQSALEGAYALGIRGLNVTVPHKRAVMPYLRGIDDMAARVGSVNTLCYTDGGYLGCNTDHTGITRTLTAQGLSFKNRQVTVLGAGGSAYAACVAAAQNGASAIAVCNRTRENADILAGHINQFYNTDITVYTYDNLPPAGENAVIIQTTTVGFGKQAGLSPVRDSSFFTGAALAFDCIYAPWETVFLQQARAAGVPAVNGFPMLVYQAEASFRIWHGANVSEYASELPDNGGDGNVLETLAAFYRRVHTA